MVFDNFTKRKETIMQNQINSYTEDVHDDCTFVVWTKSHRRCADAQDGLKKMFGVFGVHISEDSVSWPEEKEDVWDKLMDLSDQFHVLCGVFPAQVHEVIGDLNRNQDPELDLKVFSPVYDVQQPQCEPASFVRWARLL